MANNVQARIDSIIFLTGIAIFCSGILLFVSSYMVENELNGNGFDTEFGKNHCEYWAAIPAILTGILVALSTRKHLKKYHECLNYLRTCCILIMMVLALGVMIEEAADNGWSHSLVDGQFCESFGGDHAQYDHYDRQRKKICEALRKADKWFYVMLFTADILFVLTIVALFAIFTEWMLFATMKTPQNTEHSLQMSERYERFSSSETPGDSQAWEGETGDKVPLHPV